jgi:hypothetical protein
MDGGDDGAAVSVLVAAIDSGDDGGLNLLLLLLLNLLPLPLLNLLPLLPLPPPPPLPPSVDLLSVDFLLSVGLDGVCSSPPTPVCSSV